MAPLADALVSLLPKNALPYYLTHYTPPLTPLSTAPAVVAALVGYLTIVFGLREVMRDRQPLQMKLLFQLHNVLLSAGSGILLVLMVEEIFPIWRKHGLFYAMCGHGAWTSVRGTRRGRPRLTALAAAGILLHDKLLLQVLGTRRHRLPRPQEKAAR